MLIEIMMCPTPQYCYFNLGFPRHQDIQTLPPQFQEICTKLIERAFFELTRALCEDINSYANCKVPVEDYIQRAATVTSSSVDQQLQLPQKPLSAQCLHLCLDVSHFHQTEI